jgi:hypothetical protein
MDLFVTKGDRAAETSPSILGLLNKFFGSYVTLVVICFGFVGNILSIIIFLRQRRRNTAASVYLVSLALSDIGNLVMNFQMWLHNGLFYITNGEINIPAAATDLICQFRIFVWNSFVFMSAYIIIVYNVERCVAVWSPLKVAGLFTNRRRNTILIILLLSSFIFYCPAFWTHMTGLYEIQGITRKRCTRATGIAPPWVIYGFRMWYFSTNMAAPVCIVFILNLLIVIGVNRASKEMQTSKVTKNDALQRKLIKNLLIVSCIYFFSTAPYVIFQCIYNSLGMPKSLAEWSATMPNFIVFNYSINFIIYACTLKFFREDLLDLFCRT